MNSLYGNYRTRTFSQIFPDVDTWTNEIKFKSAILCPLENSNIQTLYYLLYAKYGNSSIASSDENQFKYKVFSTIFMYGPAWQKRLWIQNEVNKLNLDDVIKGSSAIYNSAANPSTSPATDSDEVLPYINTQNTTKYKKSKLEGLAILNELVKTDVTLEFLDKFKKLFITVVQPEQPLWYITENNEGDD